MFQTNILLTLTSVHSVQIIPSSYFCPPWCWTEGRARSLLKAESSAGAAECPAAIANRTSLSEEGI